MSKQLSAESQASKAIKEYAARLLTSQEKINRLEDVLQKIIDAPAPHNESEMWCWIHTARNLANEALTPNNTNKEDE